MEELLNKLIEKGWEPFGMKDVFIETGEGYDFEAGWIILKKEKGGTYTCESKYMPYRMLCTKSSGLWQFVCENGMVGDGKLKHNWVSQVEWGLDVDCKRKVSPTKYEYRLIESALKDESELEEFLLNNINVDE